MSSVSRQPEVWVSDGVPSDVPERLAFVSQGRLRRLPLVGGVTVWGEPPPREVTVLVACPNRLGAYERLPPGGQWGQVWWWSDPLCAHRSPYRDAPRVHRTTAPVLLPSGPSLAEAARRCERGADYLVRRIRQIRGVQVPSVRCGRRFPILLPMAPALLLDVAEELVVPRRSVDGWPGLLLCEVGWWQSKPRLDAVVEAVQQAVGGAAPTSLTASERVWSSTDL